MFETFNTPRHEVMAITSMQAMKLNKTPSGNPRQTQDGAETQGSVGQSLTIGQAEKMLKTLVEEGWFERSQKGYYSLSPRALMELRGWLLETYNDVEEEDDEDVAHKKIKQCFACKEVITTVWKAFIIFELLSLTSMQGQRCQKRTCPCRLHDICTQNFFRTQKSKKCPLCQTDWTGKDYVGERAAITAKPKQKRTGSNTAARVQSPVAVEDEVENDEVDEGDNED